MHSQAKKLHELAARVRAGDPLAAQQLRQEIELPMRLMAFRALQARTINSAIARRVRAEADRLLGPQGSNQAGGQKQLADQVADNICTSVIGQLRSRDGGREGISDTVHE